MEQTANNQEVYGISSRENRVNFNSFFGVDSLDNTVAKAEIVWDKIWEKLESKKETPMFVNFRNPYFPEKISLLPWSILDKRPNYILSTKVEGKEGMGILLDNLKDKRAIPKDDGTFWPYCISGAIYLKSNEMVRVNINRFNPSGGFYMPYVAKPKLVRGWLEQYIPPRWSNEPFEQFFNLDELVLDFKK